MTSARTTNYRFWTWFGLISAFAVGAAFCAFGASDALGFEKAREKPGKRVAALTHEIEPGNRGVFPHLLFVDVIFLKMPLRENLLQVWESMRQAAAPQEFDRREGIGNRGVWESLNRHSERRISQLKRVSKEHERERGEYTETVHVVRPTILMVLLSEQGGARIAGKCAPRMWVQIEVNGQVQHKVRCDGAGRFLAIFDQGFGAGDYVLSTSVRLGSGMEQSGQDVRVYVPDGFNRKFAALKNSDHSFQTEPFSTLETQNGMGDEFVAPDVRDYAEALARAASDRFSQLTAQENVNVGSGAKDHDEMRGQEERQGEPPQSPSGLNIEGAGRSKSNLSYIYDEATHALDWVMSWQAFSTKLYFQKVAADLTGLDGSFAGTGDKGNDRFESSATFVDIPLHERPEGGVGFEAIRIDVFSYLSAASDWIDSSYTQYRERIVKQLAGGDGHLPEIQVAKKEDREDSVTTIQSFEETKDENAPLNVEIQSPPGGRLASRDQIEESVSVSKREASRLKQERALLAKPSAHVLKAIKDKQRLEKELIEREKQTAQKLEKALEEKIEKERLRRERLRDIERSDQNWMTDRLRVLEPEKAKENAPKTPKEEPKKQPKKEPKDTPTLEKEAPEPRPDGLRKKIEHNSAPERVLPLLPERNSVRKSIRADVFALPARNPERKLKKFAESRIGLPIRKPDRQFKRIREGRSALGARALIVKEKDAGSGIGRVGTKVSRTSGVSRVKKRHSRAVRSYSKRSRSVRKRRLRKSRRPRSYVVRRGDTLWAIARRYYGAGHRYRLIHRANRGKIPNPHKIRPHQRLRLPAVKR